MTGLLTSMIEVFTSITGNVTTVLQLFVTCTVLTLLLGLKFSGAIFGFAARLLHRR